ncbi:Porphobilinogen deaminase [hydrothermal vent metagenome]|uniref:hydroxymethylbilane synthase n=1 Tax=hydrothermal vent metagenome TaxID=652676 RepID=A0A3B1DYD2_9ZZZZ
MPDLLRIASRASQLALWQANYIAGQLRQQSNHLTIEIVEISTTGDRNQQEDLRSFGGQGVFTNEVQKAILDGRADVAVHSLKDLPTEPTAGLLLAATPVRESRYDVLVLPETSIPSAPNILTDVTSLESLLPLQSRVGTGSPRRQAQLLHHRPDLQMQEIRGNVETRLRKLNEGEYDAIILAEAGLNRLELQQHISAILQPPFVYPAVGQGALGLECREDDETTINQLRELNDEKTLNETTAERSLLRNLRAGCHAPLGVLTLFEQSTSKTETITLEAVVLSQDGTERIFAKLNSPVENADLLGEQLADKLRNLGASRLL